MNRWGLLSFLVLTLAAQSAGAQDAPPDGLAPESPEAEAPESSEPVPPGSSETADRLAASPPPPTSVAVVPPGYVLADAPVLDEPELVAPPLRRVIGLGTALGGGVAVGGAYTFGSGATTSGYLGPALEIHSLEAQFFFNDHLSLDISIPLLNTIIIAIASASASFDQPVPWATNFFLDFSIGDDWVRFIVGPSVGFAAVAYRGTVYAQINAGAMVGLELLTRGRAFGFRIMTRPQVQFVLPSGSSAFGVGGLALLEVGFIGYIH